MILTDEGTYGYTGGDGFGLDDQEGDLSEMDIEVSDINSSDFCSREKRTGEDTKDEKIYKNRFEAKWILVRY